MSETSRVSVVLSVGAGKSIEDTVHQVSAAILTETAALAEIGYRVIPDTLEVGKPTEFHKAFRIQIEAVK